MSVQSLSRRAGILPAGVSAPAAVGRRVATVAAVGALYALGAQLPFWFVTSPSAGVAFFPAAGLTLATLVLTPRRTWPLWLIVVGLTEFAVDLSHGQALGLALGFAVANMVEPLVGATALLQSRRRLSALRTGLVAYVAFAVVGGPLVGGVIGATTSSSFGGTDAWAATFGKWWLGDALGVLAVATAILATARPSRFEPPAQMPEIAVIAALASASIVLPAAVWHRPILYAVLPLLMWAALRGGCRAVSISGLSVAFGIGWAAATGRADKLFAGGSQTDHLVFMQLFLAVTLLAGLILAIEVADRRRAEHASRIAVSERTRAELAVMAAASTERRRIVRETHDIVGHALNAMLLQAGAARRVLDTDGEKTRELLASIEATGRDAFRDLDIALGVADQPAELQPTRGLASVPELIDGLRRAGLRVQLVVTGEPRAIPTLVDWSAYRIVQEAITNVTKHAPRGTAFVSITFGTDEIVLAVTNDGIETRANGKNRQGRGLAGLRERVAVLGGHIDAGPTPDGRFDLRVLLPAPGVRP